MCLDCNYSQCLSHAKISGKSSTKNQARAWARWLDRRNNIGIMEISVPCLKGKNNSEVVQRKISITDPIKLAQHLFTVSPSLLYGTYTEDQRIEFWSRLVHSNLQPQKLHITDSILMESCTRFENAFQTCRTWTDILTHVGWPRTGHRTWRSLTRCTQHGRWFCLGTKGTQLSCISLNATCFRKLEDVSTQSYILQRVSSNLWSWYAKP